MKILSVTGTTFLDVDKKTLGKVFVLHDVTKEQEIDRIKTEFVSNVSHELRTPLASILGFSHTILMDETMDKDTRTEFLTIILKESERLSRLIDDVLSISRMETGRRSYNMEETFLAPIIHEVAETYRHQAEEKGLTFNAYADTTASIIGDRDALKQILVNLVGNAIKFSASGGEVTVSLSQDADNAVVEVKDTGVGIPKKEQMAIFQKFYRVPRPGTQIQGTGLGLSIVKELMDAHTGTIEVFSEPNEGCLFRISFPICYSGSQKSVPL